MTFHSVGNGIMIPTDELHHFSEGLQPPTKLFSCELQLTGLTGFLTHGQILRNMLKPYNVVPNQL